MTALPSSTPDEVARPRSGRSAEAKERSPRTSRSKLKPSQESRACVVYLPVLPLQVLWRKRPEWRNDAVAIVGDETPEAPLLMLSRKAYAAGLRPGIRQGAARNLLLDLRTAVVRDNEVEALCDDIARSLQTFSPRVERVQDFTGAFFVDPTGLDLLYGGQDAWLKTVYRYLKGRGLAATVITGFDRHRCLAIAHTQHDSAKRPGPLMLKSEEDEKTRSDAVDLRLLGFPEKLCDPLSMLGVDTLGQFLALPAGELLTRFGRDAADLHARFGGQRQLPLQPMDFEVPRRVTLEVLPPDKDRERLLFTIKSALDPLLAEIQRHGEQICALHIELHLERYGNRRLREEERRVHARLEPASPTLDARSLLELIRLRLARLSLPAAVEELALEAEVVAQQGEQLDTPTERPRRDARRAAEALAKVAASFGRRSVCRAVLRDAHLPEAQYIWAPFDNASNALKVMPESLVQKKLMGQRRLLPKPELLSSDADGDFRWPNAVLSKQGPYRMSGGWWGKEANDDPSIDRDYYYAFIEGGEVLWVYFDRRRSQWFLHGRIE